MLSELPDKKGAEHIGGAGLRFFLTLFLSTFKLSAFTFGGGYVIVPMMKKQFVDKLGWLNEDDMLNFTAIAQSAPGPLAVNASLLVGFELAGIPGAVVAIIGTILPPLLILSVVSFCYNAFASNIVIANILRGMQAGVAAVVCDVTAEMAVNIFKLKKAVPVIIMAAAFILSVFLDINVVIIIIACAVFGAVYYR